MADAIIANPPKSRPLRAAGLFVLDLLGAVLVPAILESTIWRILPAHSAFAIVVKQWWLDVIVAAFMGFMMYRVWRSGTSKWAWVLPALWFAFRALPYAMRPPARGVFSGGNGFWDDFSGAGCSTEVVSCRNFFAFTVPLTRSVSYSASAFLASRLIKPVLQTDARHPSNE